MKLGGDLTALPREGLHRRLTDAIISGDVDTADAIAAEFRRRGDEVAAARNFSPDLIAELEAEAESIAAVLMFGTVEQRKEAAELLASRDVIVRPQDDHAAYGI